MNAVRRLASRVTSALAAPEAALIEAGAGGELLAAQIRLVFYGVLWLAPAAIELLGGAKPVVRVAWVALTGATVLSGSILWFVARRVHIPGIAFLTSAFDITLVSGVLVAVALMGRPLVAVNSLVAWAVYLLSIVATSLRFDLRVSLFSGLLAVVQYGAILLWVTSRWTVTEANPDTAIYGRMDWQIQIGRLMLLLVATALAMGIGLRCRRLVQAAGTDPLTGLGNRTYFQERLASELSRSKRHGSALSLIYIDIDHFKRFNDRCGHETGDAALQAVAHALKAESRREDAVARWGGEELAVALPEAKKGHAEGYFSRIRRRLAGEPLRAHAGDAALTLSGGIAEYPADGATIEDLLAVADHRLLLAKRAGRDRVVAEG